MYIPSSGCNYTVHMCVAIWKSPSDIAVAEFWKTECDKSVWFLWHTFDMLTPVHPQSCGRAQCNKSCRYRSKDLFNVHIKHHNGGESVISVTLWHGCWCQMLCYERRVCRLGFSSANKQPEFEDIMNADFLKQSKFGKPVPMMVLDSLEESNVMFIFFFLHQKWSQKKLRDIFLRNQERL